MTFEEMQKEMKKRGATTQSTNGITTRMCYDILSEAGTVFEDIPKAEKELADVKRRIEREYRQREQLLASIASRETRCAELMEVKTEEAKERIRLAEYFIQNVRAYTKDDNTAYINGLAAILAGKKPEAKK